MRTSASPKAPLASDLLFSLLLDIKGAGRCARALGIRQAPISEVPGVDGYEPAHLSADFLNRFRCSLTLMGWILPCMSSNVQSPRDLVDVIPNPPKLIAYAAQSFRLARIPLRPAS